MKEKWYLQTWFICLLIAAWPFVIPAIVGVILLFVQIHSRRKFEKARAEKYGKYDTLDASIQQLEGDLDRAKQNQQSELEKLQADFRNNKSAYDSEIAKKRQELAQLRQQGTESLANTYVDQYRYSDYDGISSEECRSKLSLLKMQEKENIRVGKFVISTSQDSKKRAQDNIKQIIRCFNCECDNILLGLSVKSMEACRKKILGSFETLNKLFAADNVVLSEAFLQAKLEELNLVYTYELKREDERQQQREIKEQLLEDERARKEIERQKQKLEKDQTQCSNEINKLMGYLQSTQSEVEKKLYAEKIQQLEEKKQELEKEKETVLEREANARAGYVYVISNIGSFGKDVYKIGMTRRLEPMDRIKELGSASVPFEFDVHAMIFSEDAPALETALHHKFEKKSVNRVNLKKEFFHVSLDEIERTVKENYNNTVTFTRVPVAREYNETLEILKSENAM